MNSLADFAITRRWPAQHPERIQLYTLATPNGVKISIMLEECGLAYEAHRIDIAAGDQHSEAFRSLNPNGKIPALIDPDGPGGRPLGLFESGAILLYLADKTGRFISSDPRLRWQTIQWLMFQMAAIGPMFGQLGYFHVYAGKQLADKRPLERYVEESRRLLGVLDRQLTGQPWMIGDDYSIADIATLGWVRNLITYYQAEDLVGFSDYARVADWLARGLARPAVARGLEVPRKP